MFDASFALSHFRANHKDSLKNILLNLLDHESSSVVIEAYKSAVASNPDVFSYPYLLIDIAVTAIGKIGITETHGRPFFYWWYPEDYFNLRADNPMIPKVIDLLSYLESVPKDDPKQNMGAYQFKAFLYAISGNRERAKDYFSKTLAVAPESTGNYGRSEAYLAYIEPQKTNN